MTIDTTARGVLECVNTAFTDAKSGRYKIDRSFYVGDVGLWFYVKVLGIFIAIRPGESRGNHHLNDCITAIAPGIR